jgi:hypothetical protein
VFLLWGITDLESLISVFAQFEMPVVSMQKDILKICIHDSAYHSNHANGTLEASWTQTSDQATAENNGTTVEPHRRLLATDSTESSCPEGKVSLWDSDLIHKAHILIFLIGGSPSTASAMTITMSNGTTPNCFLVGKCLLHIDQNVRCVGLSQPGISLQRTSHA